MSDEIEQFLGQKIADGEFPSAVWLVASSGEVVLHGAAGNAVVEPEMIAASTSTIYDVASLTKVLVTGLLAGILIEQGELTLDDAVAEYLPEFSTDDKSTITIGELAAHTSRLPAWKPLYLTAGSPDDVIEEIALTPLDLNQSAVTYSDLNFIVLGKVIERVLGTQLDEAAFDHIIGPLELKHTFFNPFALLKKRIAASENGSQFERQMCAEKGYAASEASFRKDVIWGEAHDGNAFYMGGVAGHAGLFATAEDVASIANQFLPGRSSLLQDETCELFTTNLTSGLNEHRSLGFQLASTPDSTASPALSPQSFGHLGFTGTSVWIDPATDGIYVLLTNRTHAHSLPFANINAVRRRFHELAATELSPHI